MSGLADPASGADQASSPAAAAVTAASDPRLSGVFAPICTPFARDESVDDGAVRENMARYAESGILGYLALGSNGENRSL